MGESVVAKRVERVDYEKLSANQLPMGWGGGEGGGGFKNITEPYGKIT